MFFRSSPSSNWKRAVVETFTLWKLASTTHQHIRVLKSWSPGICVHNDQGQASWVFGGCTFPAAGEGGTAKLSWECVKGSPVLLLHWSKCEMAQLLLLLQPVTVMAPATYQPPCTKLLTLSSKVPNNPFHRWGWCKVLLRARLPLWKFPQKMCSLHQSGLVSLLRPAEFCSTRIPPFLMALVDLVAAQSV